ncbi:phytanoyl-CoA dioxygenase PhyH [Actinomadura pelletieri DSM 43383]|uniref:Phytanoyl-CoA dioxygenase PhyH n=1 Tax=Actinomadura pelletieri DSM 43383 TaxID=1120940 RepID=A0A495QA87_9ACTN|nr:phytanoyl-CoA dioxygenase family protein [Actinomadura pelletieri]RKS68327.1 phytanoyl-CoA dioxygenase PhyH [Actinomadura pelletieri DSM 43383]
MLDAEQRNAFIENGFVALKEAFPRDLADQCRAIIWNDLDAEPDDPSTWPRPIATRPGYDLPPFVAAATTPRLHGAFDALVGEGRWQPRASLGGFVVRFPPDEPSVVDNWHVDVSFPGPDSSPTDYLTWRANVRSRDRALLMLFLLSDVTERDAPTRLRVGSHRDVARVLAPHHEDGLDAVALATQAEAASAHRPTAFATGSAGDVYLCHPFLVHAGRPHLGTTPRFLAQPPLHPTVPLNPEEPTAPVEIAIQRALTP